jgi:hypothetical protein
VRIVVTGGRSYADADALYAALDRLHAASPITALAHGDARGADRIADHWARSRGVPSHPYPAHWDAQGRSAGPIRNLRMLTEFRPDSVLAAPGGTGTANCVGHAERLGIPVQWVT